MTLLRTSAVTRRFGDVTAVDDVDMSVGAGEVVGLLGANGAGKTTLVKLLLGLLAPTAGRVELLGAPPTRRARARVGYLPQGLGLYEDLTVAEQLDFAARVHGYGPTAPAIAGDTGRPIATLPLGTRRLAAFAIATGHEPRVLLLDEPTSGVDPLGRAHLWDEIRTAAEEGRGVLVSTHHIAEAEQCDRLIVMAAGQVVASGRLHDVIAGHRTVAVHTDEWRRAFAALNGAALPVALDGRRLRIIDTPVTAITSGLAAAQVPARISEVPATLEEVFVQLAGHRAT